MTSDQMILNAARELEQAALAVEQAREAMAIPGHGAAVRGRRKRKLGSTTWLGKTSDNRN